MNTEERKSIISKFFDDEETACTLGGLCRRNWRATPSLIAEFQAMGLTVVNSESESNVQRNNNAATKVSARKGMKTHFDQ